jgi:hypothetical protein
MSLIPSPPEPAPQRSRKQAGGLLRQGGLTIAIPLLLAVIIGMQLGAIPWRYRRQIWLLQGFAAGALVGYLAGRLHRPERGSDGSRHG